MVYDILEDTELPLMMLSALPRCICVFDLGSLISHFQAVCTLRYPHFPVRVTRQREWNAGLQEVGKGKCTRRYQV